MKNISVNVSSTSRPRNVYNLYTNDFHLVAIWYTIGRTRRIEKYFRPRSADELYTECIHDVSKLYTSRSDFGIPNDNHWSTKKAEKVFIHTMKVPIYSIKINGGKAAKILKANNISQYFTIF